MLRAASLGSQAVERGAHEVEEKGYLLRIPAAAKQRCDPPSKRDGENGTVGCCFNTKLLLGLWLDQELVMQDLKVCHLRPGHWLAGQRSPLAKVKSMRLFAL